MKTSFSFGGRPWWQYAAALLLLGAGAWFVLKEEGASSSTAKALGRAIHRPAKPYDAEWNVHAGTFYLSRQLERFDGDETLALAAYARGPGKVREWALAGEPLPASIEGFVAKVQRARDVFAALGWPAPLEPQAPSPRPVGWISRP